MEKSKKKAEIKRYALDSAQRIYEEILQEVSYICEFDRSEAFKFLASMSLNLENMYNDTKIEGESIIEMQDLKSKMIRKTASIYSERNKHLVN